MQISNKNDAECWSSNCEQLKKEIDKLEQKILEKKDLAKKLILEENPSEGITYSKEIFELKQAILILKTEVIIRNNKINRYKFNQMEIK